MVMPTIIYNIHVFTASTMLLALVLWLFLRQTSRSVFGWFRSREASLRVVPRILFAKFDAAEFLVRAALLLLLFLAETFTLRYWISVCWPVLFDRYDPVIRKIIYGGFKAGVLLAGFLVLRKM